MRSCRSRPAGCWPARARARPSTRWASCRPRACSTTPRLPGAEAPVRVSRARVHILGVRSWCSTTGVEQERSSPGLDQRRPELPPATGCRAVGVGPAAAGDEQQVLAPERCPVMLPSPVNTDADEFCRRAATPPRCRRRHPGRAETRGRGGPRPAIRWDGRRPRRAHRRWRPVWHQTSRSAAWPSPRLRGWWRAGPPWLRQPPWARVACRFPPIGPCGAANWSEHERSHCGPPAPFGGSGWRDAGVEPFPTVRRLRRRRRPRDGSSAGLALRRHRDSPSRHTLG